MKIKIIILLAMFAIVSCSKKNPTGPEKINLSGEWSGTALASADGALFIDFTITHSNADITGNGYTQLSGSIVKSFFSVSGRFNDGTVNMTMKSQNYTIFFNGTASENSISGMISGIVVERKNIIFIKH